MALTKSTAIHVFHSNTTPNPVAYILGDDGIIYRQPISDGMTLGAWTALAVPAGQTIKSFDLPTVPGSDENPPLYAIGSDDKPYKYDDKNDVWSAIVDIV